MERKERFPSPKFLYRLLVFALLLSAVPVILIGTISYYIASRDIGEKVNEGNVQILQQNQMRIEQMLKSAEMGAVQYINSSLASDYIYQNLQYDDFQTINNLSKGLYNLHSIAGVADTQLINVEHGWMISNLGFTSTKNSADMKLLDEYAGRPQQLFWLASVPPSANSNAPEALPEAGKIRLVIKLPMVASSTVPKALLLLDMSYDALLSNLAPNTQLGRIYVLNREGVPFLSSSGKEPVLPAILQQLRASEGTSGFFENSKAGVNYRVSPYNGWTYVSIVSIEAITKVSKRIGLVTLNACIVLFIVIALAASYATRRMYRPIGRLFTIMEQTGEPGGSRQRDEFAFMEERFSTMFSTRKQLQQQLQVQRGQVKEFFLLKLLLGQVTESEFAYKNETYGFGEKGKAIGVLALQIDSLEGTRYLDSDKELLLFAINNVVAELIPQDSMFGTVLLDQSQVTLLLGHGEQTDELQSFFYRIAEEMKAKVHELLKLKVSIGISRPFYKYTNAMDAYMEALEALKRRISLGNELILGYEDIGAVDRDGGQPSAIWNHLEESLLNSLKTGDAKASYDFYGQYVASVLEKQVSYSDFQIGHLLLIAKIYRLVQQQGGTLDGLSGSKSVVNRFMKLYTVEETIAWFKTELIPPVLAFLQSRIDSQYINIAQQMTELIHEKYDQDITLESCAEQFRFHPVYLSRVFKKETGTTFIDYLTNYRMDMAKLWLKDSDMKITEIAERLNYNNSSGFIRTFRKSTGMTPGQYREALAESQQRRAPERETE